MKMYVGMAYQKYRNKVGGGWIYILVFVCTFFDVILSYNGSVSMNLPPWRETVTVTLSHNTGNPAGPRQTLSYPVLGVLVTDRFYYL